MRHRYRSANIRLLENAANVRDVINCARGGTRDGVEALGEKAHAGGAKRRRCTIQQLSARGSATPDSLVSWQKAAELPLCAGIAHTFLAFGKESWRTTARRRPRHVHRRSAMGGIPVPSLMLESWHCRSKSAVLSFSFSFERLEQSYRGAKKPPLVLPQRNSPRGTMKVKRQLIPSAKDISQ